MLVYVLCYGAGMLFASSAHYYLSSASLLLAAVWLYWRDVKKYGSLLDLLEAVEAADGLEPKNMALLFLRRGSFPAGLRAGAFVLSVPGTVKKGEKEMGRR